MSTPITKRSSRRKPERIEAKPLRHPGRWVAAAVLLVLFALFVFDAARREAYGWGTYWAYLFDTRILIAAGHTLAITVLSMIIGVVLGVITAMILFARRVAHVTRVERTTGADGTRYTVHGPLFFGSSNDLVEQFDYAADAERGLPVAVDFTAAQIWDASTVAVLDSVQAKYVEHGLEVSFTGLDDRSTLFHGRLTGTLN